MIDDVYRSICGQFDGSISAVSWYTLLITHHGQQVLKQCYTELKQEDHPVVSLGR